MQETTELAVNSLTVHRLVISSVLIAVKMTDDRYYNNAFFAKIGGVALSELNVMELEMLKLLDFRTHVPASEIKWLLSRLKSLQGPGQVTSVLCRKRMTRSVDDLPAPKQREIQHEMNTPKAAWITSQQHTESNSAAQKGLNCRWQSAALQVPVKSAEMTCSPSNGIHLPQASVGVVNEPCSLQETKFKAFLVEISSIKVSV